MKTWSYFQENYHFDIFPTILWKDIGWHFYTLFSVTRTNYRIIVNAAEEKCFPVHGLYRRAAYSIGNLKSIQGELFFCRRLIFLYVVKICQIWLKLENMFPTRCPPRRPASLRTWYKIWAKLDNFLLHTKIWAVYEKRKALLEWILVTLL